MDFSLSEDHEALRDSAANFLNKEVDHSPLLVPKAKVDQAGYDKLWPQIVELGWPAIVVPESYGGLGMSYIDLIMIIGEMGRTLAAAPLFGTLAGSWMVEAAGSEAQKSELLGAVAAGELKMALAVADDDGGLDNAVSSAKASKASHGYVLSGSKNYVVDAASSDKIVVAADSDDGRQFFIIDSDTAGVRIETLDWRDITREVCSLQLDNVPAQLLENSNPECWPWVRDRLYLVLATESMAGIKFVLSDTVEYAKQRVAFGRPIGSFQAIKHQLADIAGLSELTEAAVQYAAWALSESDEKATIAVTMAQSYASDSYNAAVHRYIQVFGAIGFTWEMKNHLYFKRARANSELLGSPVQQREEVIQILERKAA